MRIASFPKMDDFSRNPYLYLTKVELENNGVQVIGSNPNILSGRWLWRNRKKVQVLHFHWLQYHYVNIEKLKVSYSALFTFFRNILFAYCLGYKIVWTLHDVVPHENKFPFINEIFRKVLLRFTHAVIVHCQYARDFFVSRYSKNKRVFVFPHPQYTGFYPNEISQLKAREILNIPEKSMVFTFLGEVRSYKGVDKLLKAFSAYKNKEAVLLLAGRALFPEVEEKLAPVIQQDKRIRQYPYFIPTEEIQWYFNAADVVIFPFSRITMSGSLLLAFSFKKAVMAPPIGGVGEYIDSDNAVLYDPESEKGLLKALKKCEDIDLNRMGEKGYNSIKNYTWKRFAGELKDVYQSIALRNKQL